MAETPMPAVNGLDQIPPIKTEPVDPLLDPAEPPVVPKEFLESEESDYSEVSESEEMPYFTQVEVDNTRKCLENTRLIIKDFETQLDWHLQQYMLLRNPYNLKKNSKGPGRGGDDTKRQDLLSISQLSTIIANHPEGNKKFIKRSGPILEANGKNAGRIRILILRETVILVKITVMNMMRKSLKGMIVKMWMILEYLRRKSLLRKSSLKEARIKKLIHWWFPRRRLKKRFMS
jgi:hypothetical protein